MLQLTNTFPNLREWDSSTTAGFILLTVVTKMS